MRFIFLLFIVFFSFRTISFAQKDTQPLSVVEPYIQQKNIHSDTGAYLVKVAANAVKEFKKNYRNNIKRQVDEDWFVIRTSQLVMYNSALITNLYQANDNWKLSPVLLRLLPSLLPNLSYTFLIQTQTGDSSFESIKRERDMTIISSDAQAHIFQVRATLLYIQKHILADTSVVFIDIKMTSPKEETVINDYDNSVNGSNLLMAKYPGVAGRGLSVSIKENRFDTTDIDFKGRYLLPNNASSFTTTHATTMATLIAGGGNSFHTGKGIAPESNLSSSDFQNLLPDSNASYQRYGTTVQNHSYGTSLENFYGADATAFDQATLDNPNLVYVFSAGNSGALTDSNGTYRGLPHFATLTGSFKQAKNIITVGSVDSFFHIPTASSKGPAYDGRIKPELVAYGNDGSSGAAAIASGTALAVQSAYRMAHHDSLPQNGLVKVILLNSADDVFNEGPDYYSGYGNVNAYRAVKDVLSGHYYTGKIKQNSVDSFLISIPNNVRNMKLTLVWNDMPAKANAFAALVNDLDLSLKNKNNNSTWLPWVLDSSPDSARLLSPPHRGRDSLNVVEQITLSNPLSGSYAFYITGHNVETDTQLYHIAFEMDTANQFQFVSPSGVDHFQGGNKSIIRWHNTYDNNTKGNLSYSINKGLTWKLIDESVPLINNYYQWVTPDTSAVALLRMNIDNDVYVSDTFDVSKQPLLNVVINCSDSSLLTWQKTAGVNTYRVFQLGEKYLQPYRDVNDTSISITKNSSPYIAVSPLLGNGRIGFKSYTINIDKQGAGCYINNFLADLTPDNKAELTLTLGAVTGVDSVWFQWLEKGKWRTVYATTPIHDITIQNTFSSLIQGANTFRAVVWVNGMAINSQEVNLLYFYTAEFIIKPNPIPQGEQVTILASTLVTGTLVLYDVWGRKLLQQEITNANNTINTSLLSKGIYFLVIYDKEQAVYKSRLIIN